MFPTGGGYRCHLQSGDIRSGPLPLLRSPAAGGAPLVCAQHPLGKDCVVMFKRELPGVNTTTGPRRELKRSRPDAAGLGADFGHLSKAH